MPVRTVRRDCTGMCVCAVLGLVFAGSVAWAMEPESDGSRSLMVTATAYNSVPGQTSGHADLTAWGHRLRPGMRAVAVSADLITLGLGNGARLRIAGLPGEYVVVDRLPSRWKRRIDIYMGTSVRRALDWGRRRVRIVWTAVDDPQGTVPLADHAD